jgi:hypothetical protein
VTHQPYPNVHYSKEAATFMMAITALQRANGMGLDEAIEYGIAKYWEFTRSCPSGGHDLDGWRTFMKAVGGPS